MARDALVEIAALAAVRHQCKLGEVLETLDPDLVPGVRSALTESALAASAIAKWFKLEGHVVSDRTIQRHRRGECACD